MGSVEVQPCHICPAYISPKTATSTVLSLPLYPTHPYIYMKDLKFFSIHKLIYRQTGPHSA